MNGRLYWDWMYAKPYDELPWTPALPPEIRY
jgi:hypothetical protein